VLYVHVSREYGRSDGAYLGGQAVDVVRVMDLNRVLSLTAGISHLSLGLLLDLSFSSHESKKVIILVIHMYRSIPQPTLPESVLRSPKLSLNPEANSGPIEPVP
jgi:hypothetical protein